MNSQLAGYKYLDSSILLAHCLSVPQMLKIMLGSHTHVLVQGHGGDLVPHGAGDVVLSLRPVLVGHPVDLMGSMFLPGVVGEVERLAVRLIIQVVSPGTGHVGVSW